MKSYFNVFQVSASALEAQRRRMNVITSNMANVNTTRTDQGGPYRRKDVVFTPEIIESNPVELQGVRIAEIVEDKTPFKKMYDPAHPDADKDGYVEMPNVNIIEEMVNMMAAMRAYEASVSAFNTAKSIFLKSLEIGRM
jgi:flagellar basal-body rod protein FlgC